MLTEKIGSIRRMGQTVMGPLRFQIDTVHPANGEQYRVAIASLPKDIAIDRQPYELILERGSKLDVILVDDSISPNSHQRKGAFRLVGSLPNGDVEI
jgi:hypothetical protein